MLEFAPLSYSRVGSINAGVNIDRIEHASDKNIRISPGLLKNTRDGDCVCSQKSRSSERAQSSEVLFSSCVRIEH